MTAVFAIIGCFVVTFFLMALIAIFFIKPDHSTESEEQFGSDEKKSKIMVNADGIDWESVKF